MTDAARLAALRDAFLRLKHKADPEQLAGFALEVIPELLDRLAAVARHPMTADLAYAPDGRLAGIVVKEWLIEAGEAVEKILALEARVHALEGELAAGQQVIRDMWGQIEAWQDLPARVHALEEALLHFASCR